MGNEHSRSPGRDPFGQRHVLRALARGKAGEIMECANRGLLVNSAAAKPENVWSDFIISDLILLYLICPPKQVQLEPA